MIGKIFEVAKLKGKKKAKLVGYAYL